MSISDIAGYTYQAENYTPEKLVEVLVLEGALVDLADAAFLPTEKILDKLAEQRGIDRYDERSFDSGDFPKVIFTSQITEDDADWYEPS